MDERIHKGEINMVFYFTATGNCLYVAKQLDAERISIAQEPLGKRYEADAIGVVCPIYGHDIPSNIREFLRQAEFVTGYFYMVLTFGYCQGGAATRTEEFLKRMGKRADYINALKMVDNALPAFDIEEELRIDPDKRVEEHLAAIRDDIAARKHFVLQPSQWDIEYHKKFLNAPFKLDPETDFRQKGQALYRISDDACVGCGVCTKVCPRGCFSLKEGKARHDIANCVACLACIHACPQKAIQFTFPEKNPNARYRNPHITLAEIIAANRQEPMKM